jgi:tetratricopeptide (TPR) repeat protein
VQHFVAAERLSPDLASPHYNLAIFLQKQNRLEDAEREYRAALALSSDQMEIAQAHNNLGILYLVERKYAQALPELSAAIAIDPNEQNRYIGRGMVEMEMMNADAAIADFTKAAQIAPSPLALYQLGRALESKGENQQAAKAYAAALQLAPAMVEARARLDALRARPE